MKAGALSEQSRNADHTPGKATSKSATSSVEGASQQSCAAC